MSLNLCWTRMTSKKSFRVFVIAYVCPLWGIPEVNFRDWKRSAITDLWKPIFEVVWLILPMFEHLSLSALGQVSVDSWQALEFHWWHYPPKVSWKHILMHSYHPWKINLTIQYTVFINSTWSHRLTRFSGLGKIRIKNAYGLSFYAMTDRVS